MQGVRWHSSTTRSGSRLVLSGVHFEETGNRQEEETKEKGQKGSLKWFRAVDYL